MSLILNIDTAAERAHVSFAKDGFVIQTLYSQSQKEHASFLQTAIEQLTTQTDIKLKEIDAVAVTAGPVHIPACGLAWPVQRVCVMHYRNHLLRSIPSKC